MIEDGTEGDGRGLNGRKVWEESCQYFALLRRETLSSNAIVMLFACLFAHSYANGTADSVGNVQCRDMIANVFDGGQILNCSNDDDDGENCFVFVDGVWLDDSMVEFVSSEQL